MVEHILARSTRPLLLLVTARPELAEGRSGWSSRVGMSQISLEPLTRWASSELVAELLPHAGADLRERVVTTAEGNPFFAEELARHLSEELGEPAAIPNTVRALLAARVDRLTEPEKQVLQDAAVVGRDFWATTLESIEARPDLAATLRRLENRGLVLTRPSSSLPGQTELSFWHGLTREVAYRSIPRARRCRAHAAVGEWLEELAGDRREEFIDRLAHHYEAASARGDAALAWPPESTEPDRLRTKAVAALVEAGDAARKRLSIDEALAAYTAGMAIARTLGDREALSRLRAYAVLLCVRYAGALTGDGWQTRAIELVEEGLTEEDEGSVTFERGALLVGRSWGLQHRWLQPPTRDLATARRDVEQAIAIAETIDSHELLAAALEGLTWLTSEQGFCEAGSMALRLIRASSGSMDRVEAHESKVTAAICFG